MAPLLLFLFTLFLSSLFYYLLFSRSNGTKGQRLPLPPGPRGWPILGNLPQVGPKPHQTFFGLSKVYGSLFRLRFGSVDVIVAASAAVAAQFLKVHDANFSNRPFLAGAEHVAYNRQDLAFAPYGPRWRMLRKLCALHIFSPKALDDLRPVRATEVANLARALHARARARCAVNMGQVLYKCTTNALSQAMLGRRVFGEGEESRGAADSFQDMVLEMMRLAGVFNVGDFVPALRWFDLQGVVRDMKKLHRRYDSFINKVIEENWLMAAEGDGLLSELLRLVEDREEGDGGKLTNTNIKALLFDLFSAGTDTTSSTVEWALAEMIRHPEILKKAQSELDSVVGRDRLVSETDLAHLPFFHAVVKETFRLHPATPLSLPRIASEACEVNGFHIPQNAMLVVNIWAIARDPNVWADPLEFRPARFLPGGGYENIDVKGNDFGVIPFGAGRRICVGLSWGLRMVQFATATLIHAFDWALPDPQVAERLDMEEAYGLTLQRAIPLTVHPVPRLAQKTYEAAC